MADEGAFDFGGESDAVVVQSVSDTELVADGLCLESASCAVRVGVSFDDDTGACVAFGMDGHGIFFEQAHAERFAA